MTMPLFAGPGPAREAHARFDWSTHPLGEPRTWPSALKVALRLIFAAPESMYVTWGEEEFFFFNDAYIPALGPRLSQAVGSTLPVLWADVYEQVRPLVVESRAGRATRVDDLPLAMAREGVPEDTWWSFFFSPLFDEDGTVAGMFCVTNETTARVLQTRHLLAVEEQHRMLSAEVEQQITERALVRSRTWQISSELLAVSSTGDHFESTNPAWQRVLGWSSEELAVTAYPNFVHPEDVADTHRAFAEARTSNALVRLENRLKKKNGAYRWFSWSILRDGGQFYCSARDITDEKAKAEALESAERQLRQAQKMEAVGQLTGGLAHDFNNLLGGIMGCIEVIQSRIEQGRTDNLDRFISGATTAARRAAALTHRLLAFSRQQTLTPAAIDVNRLVNGMQDLIARTMGPAIVVEVVGAAGLWPVFADASQVDNALLNLCINARDAMPEGGTITIETGNRWIDHRTALERNIAPGQYVSLCVSDTGSGMSPSVMARAFDPFFTTKPIGQGTGLGLSMIFGFARQSEGDVRIYSEEGQGTMVCLYLPRHAGEADSEHIPLPQEMTGGEGTVLVVDDEPSIRMLLVESLTELGYSVHEAWDGPSALRILESTVELDLLITDVGLPGGMNGRQVADAARTKRVALPVLFITGYAENAAISHGHLDTGMAVLTKPFSLVDLSQRVSAILGNRPRH